MVKPRCISHTPKWNSTCKDVESKFGVKCKALTILEPENIVNFWRDW